MEIEGEVGKYCNFFYQVLRGGLIIKEGLEIGIKSMGSRR